MKHRHWLLVVLDWLLIGVTIVSSLALLFVLVAGRIDPRTTTFFAFFALGAPLIYLFNVLLLAIWGVRWRGWALLPLVVLVWGVWSLGEFVQVRFVKQYATTSSKTTGELTVASYNVHSFRVYNLPSTSSLGDILHFLASDNCDVVCLQEYQLMDSSEFVVMDNIAQKWPHRAYMYDVSKAFNHSGQVVMSKYPLSKSHPIPFDGTANGAMYVDVYAPMDTIRLFNCHLQTTAFNRVNNERGVRALLADENSEQITRSAIRSLSENFVVRASQADTVAMLIHNSPYPVIALGDLNSPPMTYTYRRVRGNLADAFCEQGSGYGYTYKPMAKLFRIDYVFFDDKVFECLQYESPNKVWSDHNPLIVKLKRK